MSMFSDMRQQQHLRAAEGYLDLVMVFADRWPLSLEHRDQIANRALRELSLLDLSQIPNGHVRYLQGQALRAMESYEEAIEPFQIALEWDPDNIYIYLALAWCYKRLDRLDLAIQALEDAMSVDPDEAIIHYNLACYWALTRNVRMAVRYLDHSFAIDPKYRDQVADEADFDPVRDDPEFQSFVRVIV